MVDFDNSLVSHDDKYLLKKANYNITIDGYHVVFRIDNNYWYDKLRPGTHSRVFMPANIGPSLVNWEYIFFGNYDIKRYYSNTIFIKVVM